MKKLLVISGIVLAIAAIFAVQIGLDNDAGWGRGRITLLAFGIVLCITGLFLHVFGEKLAERWVKTRTAFDNVVSRDAKISIATAFSFIIVLSSYVWIAQLEQRYINKNNFYAELASSFKNGHLYLNEQPSAALLALENPYDFFLRKREGVEDFPWNASLYKGKFYLYWGPVPAVFLMLFSRAWLSKIGDFHLALAFACGWFTYMALLVSSFWRKNLTKSPAWLLGFILLVIGFATPVTIMLKDGGIFDAAIFGAQFFFIGGCYWAYQSLIKERLSLGLLMFASLHGALAVGTRVIILLAVGFSAGLTLFFIYKAFSLKTIKEFVSILIALGLPLAMVGFGLAYYNYARFGNILEFGLTYQLAGVDYTNAHGIFSFSKIQQNLNLYFLYPVKIHSQFPYLYRVEYVNSNARMAGLVFVTPFLILALPLFRLLRSISSRVNKLHYFLYSISENWLIFLLVGSWAWMFFLLMSYYFVAMRFVLDFMPALLGFIAIQTGRDYEELENKLFLRNSLVFTVLVLGIITIIANFLLAVPESGISFTVNLIHSISQLIGLR